MSTPRFSALRRERDGGVVTILSPGCPEVWERARGPLPDWRGIDSGDGTGLTLEVDEGSERVVLEEQTTYTVRLTGTHHELAGFGAPTVRPVSAKGADEAVFRLETGNLVGLTSIAFGPSGPGATTSIAARIRVRKLGDPDSDFAWLVTSVVQAIRGLALTVASPTTLKTARTSRGISYAYEDLVFLRAIAGDVTRAVERIAKNPHRRVIQRLETMDSWLAPEVSPAGLASVAGDPRSVARVSAIGQRRLLTPAAREPFTRRDAYFAPVRIPATRRVVDYDTYENRFVRFAVTSLRRRALSIADAARRANRPSLAHEAEEIAVRFASLLRLHPFDEVGDLTSFVSTSQVLMREDAYNRLLRLYREFVLTADVVWDRFRTLQQNRDVAALYEMWVFIETVRAVGTFLGQGAVEDDSPGALIRTRPDGLHINLAEGTRSTVAYRLPDGHVRVSYNRSYRSATTDPRAKGDAASYSLTLRPDVSITVGRGPMRRRILLDAKYRVDGLSPALVANQGDADDEAAPQGTFKPSDLHKMHTYRDAIGGAFAAVAVYPGMERRLYPPAGPDLVARGGVGALPLRPGGGYDPAGFSEEVAALVGAAWASMDPSGSPADLDG